MYELSPEHVFPSIRYQLQHFRRIVLGILLIAAVFAAAISFATLEKRVTAPGTVDGLRIYELKAPDNLTVVEVMAPAGSRIADDAVICRATSFMLEAEEERLAEVVKEKEKHEPLHDPELVRQAAKYPAFLRRNIEAWRKRLTFRAPDSGVVLEAPRKGQRVSSGDVVARFAADREKYVTAHVSERMIHRVAPGMPARVKWEGGVIPAAVDSIGIVPEPQGKLVSFPVRLRLKASIAELRHGSRCRVEIITGRSRVIRDLLGFDDRKNHAALPEESDDDAAQQQKGK